MKKISFKTLITLCMLFFMLQGTVQAYTPESTIVSSPNLTSNDESKLQQKITATDGKTLYKTSVKWTDLSMKTYSTETITINDHFNGDQYMNKEPDTVDSTLVNERFPAKVDYPTQFYQGTPPTSIAENFYCYSIDGFYYFYDYYKFDNNLLNRDTDLDNHTGPLYLQDTNGIKGLKGISWEYQPFYPNVEYKDSFSDKSKIPQSETIYYYENKDTKSPCKKGDEGAVKIGEGNGIVTDSSYNSKLGVWIATYSGSCTVYHWRAYGHYSGTMETNHLNYTAEVTYTENYTPPSVTLRHLDINGNPLIADEKITDLVNGTSCSVYPDSNLLKTYDCIKYKDKAGAETAYDKTKTYTVTLSSGENATVAFIYKPKARITLRHLDTNGTPLIPDEQISNLVNGTSCSIAPDDELLKTYDCIKYRNKTGAEESYDKNKIYTVTLQNGESVTVSFIYKKIPPPSPPSVKINAPTIAHAGGSVWISGTASDPNGLKITKYYWSFNPSGAGNFKDTDTSGIIRMTTDLQSSNTIYLCVENENGIVSDFASASIKPINYPPYVNLVLQKQAVLGDDITYSINAGDSDGDSITYEITNPTDVLGNISNNGGLIYFNSIGKKQFKVKVTDTFGATAEALAEIEIIAPVPKGSLNITGSLKENRKVSIECIASSGSQRGSITENKTIWKLYKDGVLTDNVKTIADKNGNLKFDCIVSQKGHYKAECTVFNDYGNFVTVEKEFDITEDLPPVGNFSMPTISIRDPEDKDELGRPLFSNEEVDHSYSPDGDEIEKRIWLICPDANNNLIYDDEWIVFDSGAWKPLKQFTGGNGTWTDIRDGLLDLDKINDGNVTDVIYKTPYVGKFCSGLITREKFGEPTISELVSSKDKRTEGFQDFNEVLSWEP